MIDKLMHYFDTDAVCYHEEFPEVLTELQDKYWTPIIEWAEKTYDVKINTTTDIFAISQPDETKAKFRAVIDAMDSLELAAFEKAVMSSKSFLIGFAVVHKGVSVEHASNAAQVEMMAQMDRWGEVEDSKFFFFFCYEKMVLILLFLQVMMLNVNILDKPLVQWPLL